MASLSSEIRPSEPGTVGTPAFCTADRSQTCCCSASSSLSDQAALLTPSTNRRQHGAQLHAVAVVRTTGGCSSRMCHDVSCAQFQEEPAPAAATIIFLLVGQHLLSNLTLDYKSPAMEAPEQDVKLATPKAWPLLHRPFLTNRWLDAAAWPVFLGMYEVAGQLVYGCCCRVQGAICWCDRQSIPGCRFTAHLHGVPGSGLISHHPDLGRFGPDELKAVIAADVHKASVLRQEAITLQETATKQGTRLA